jgi:hypothetical protein
MGGTWGASASPGFVACDPGNLRTLANRMHDLASCIASETATIKTLMQQWEDESSWTPLPAVQSRFAEQATDVGRRADLAADLAKKVVAGFNVDTIVVNGAPLCSGGNLVTLPFDVKDGGYTTEAVQDAAALKKALDAGDGQSNLDAINSVAQTLADHQDDPAYLATFYGNGGAEQVYRLPDVIRSWGNDDYRSKNENLTPDGQNIVKPFAASLAAATKAIPNFPLLTNAFDASKTPGDPSTGIPSWSMSQLFALGPDGSQWAANFLAVLGTKDLAFSHVWSRHNVDGGWTPDADTLTPLLKLIGANPLASAQLLSGTDGATNAQLMIDDNSVLATTRDGIPLIFSNTTLTDQELKARGLEDPGPEGLFGSLRGQAALNVLQALGNGPKTLTPDTAQALATIARGYMSDMVKSADGTYVSDGISGPGEGSFQITSETLSTLLADIAADSTASDNFTSYMLDQTRQSVGAPDVTTSDQVKGMGTLMAKFMVAQQNGDIAKAKQIDSVNADRQMWVQMLLGGFGNSSLNVEDEALPASATSQVLAGVASGAGSSFLDSFWPTDNAANTASDAQTALGKTYGKLDIPIVQGMLQRGTLKPVDFAGESWFHDGKVAPQGDETDSFTNWEKERLPKLNPAGYQAFINYRSSVQLGMIAGGMNWGVTS